MKDKEDLKSSKLVLFFAYVKWNWCRIPGLLWLCILADVWLNWYFHEANWTMRRWFKEIGQTFQHKHPWFYGKESTCSSQKSRRGNFLSF